MNHTADRVAAWTDLLDEFERVLDAQAECLATGAGIDLAPAFSPPASMPRLPEALAPRALALSDRSSALLARARQIAERARPPVRRVHRQPAATASTLFDELA